MDLAAEPLPLNVIACQVIIVAKIHLPNLAFSKFFEKIGEAEALSVHLRQGTEVPKPTAMKSPREETEK